MFSNLPLGEKLKQIRVAKGYSLENIGRATNTSERTIGRIERGDANSTPSMEQLAILKEALDIPNAPLLDYELATYESRLWYLHELITTDRMQDAKNTVADLSVIIDLPFERDLIAIFLLSEARILINEQNVQEAIVKIDTVETYVNDAGYQPSAEVLHLFHSNKSGVYFWQGNYKQAIAHGLKTLGYESTKLKASTHMLRNIGGAYLLTGQPFHAVRYLEQSISAFKGDITSFHVAIAKGILASCYTQIHDFDKARALLNEALLKARGVNDEMNIGRILIELGHVSSESGDYNHALTLYDQALKLLKNHKDMYAQGHIYKGVTLIHLKQFAECEKLIAEGRAVVNEIKESTHVFLHEMLTQSFDMLHHRINLKDSNSVAHLERVSIPYYRSIGQKYVALEICTALEEHYRKQRSKMKELTIKGIKCDVLMEMMYGGAEE